MPQSAKHNEFNVSIITTEQKNEVFFCLNSRMYAEKWAITICKINNREIYNKMWCLKWIVTVDSDFAVPEYVQAL